MVSGLARCSFVLRPAGSLTRDLYSRAFGTKGFEQGIATKLASAATGWSVSCRVGLLLSHWSSVPFHGAPIQALSNGPLMRFSIEIGRWRQGWKQPVPRMPAIEFNQQNVSRAGQNNEQRGPKECCASNGHADKLAELSAEHRGRGVYHWRLPEGEIFFGARWKLAF